MLFHLECGYAKLPMMDMSFPPLYAVIIKLNAMVIAPTRTFKHLFADNPAADCKSFSRSPLDASSPSSPSSVCCCSTAPPLGIILGASLGILDTLGYITSVGITDGTNDGASLGTCDETALGVNDGPSDGTADADVTCCCASICAFDGEVVGPDVGDDVGPDVDPDVGLPVGDVVGLIVGRNDGVSVVAC